MVRLLSVIECALDEMPFGALSKTSPLKPRSMSPELLDTLTTFLSEAMRTVTDDALLRKLSSTMTKYANVRGDFRYKVTAGHGPCKRVMPEHTTAAVRLLVTGGGDVYEAIDRA